MPRGGEEGRREAPPAVRGGGLDVLPDELIQHVLGFLEAPEAVRTCLVARRWRHLWKSATGLRVVAGNGKFLGSPAKLREFMNHLLPLCAGSQLDVFVLSLGTHYSDDPSFVYVISRCVNASIRHALACKARVLKIWIRYESDGSPNARKFELQSMPLKFEHLMRLELYGVLVHGNFLDLSGCPALERLKLDGCDLYMTAPVNKIISESLKHLIIIASTDILGWCMGGGFPIQICTPNLVSLYLDRMGRLPRLEGTPSIVQAFLGRSVESQEGCSMCNNDGCMCCDNWSAVVDGTGSSLLLNGFIGSEEFVLDFCTQKVSFVYKRDSRWCPTFSNLKTLLLNGRWCVPDDFCALVGILEHSPVLEKLIIEHFSGEPKYEMEMTGSIKPMVRSAAILEHLKIIEVKCDVVDAKIYKLTLFLCAFHIRKLTYCTLYTSIFLIFP
ncbi:hypothetical protein ACP4OV_023471 [Aristida adscensionis]